MPVVAGADFEEFRVWFDGSSRMMMYFLRLFETTGSPCGSKPRCRRNQFRLSLAAALPLRPTHIDDRASEKVPNPHSPGVHERRPYRWMSNVSFRQRGRRIAWCKWAGCSRTRTMRPARRSPAQPACVRSPHLRSRPGSPGVRRDDEPRCSTSSLSTRRDGPERANHA